MRSEIKNNYKSNGVGIYRIHSIILLTAVTKTGTIDVLSRMM